MQTEFTEELLQISKLERHAKCLLDRVRSQEFVFPGRKKLERRIKSEVDFYCSLKAGQTACKAEHLNSTNLAHLNGVVSYIEDTDLPLRAVFTQFMDDQGNETKVDVVTGVGTSTTWIKLSARSRSATRRVVQGDCGYNQRSVVDVARSLQAAAAHNTVEFTAPTVVMKFCGEGVYHCVAHELRMTGVEVIGCIHLCTDESCCLGAHESEPEHGNARAECPSPCPDSVTSNISISQAGDTTFQESGVAVEQCPRAVPETDTVPINYDTTVNLDVSTMIVLVSEMTNSQQHVSPLGAFKDRVLRDMCAKERDAPVLPLLLPQLEGMRFIACSIAVASFKKIVFTMGGTKERERATKLLERIRIVPDEPSTRCTALRLSARIKENTRLIFGVGDHLRIRTVSANTGFVRSAASQGVRLSAITHDGRGLCESARRIPWDTIDQTTGVHTVARPA
eukprot:m.422583 g.422583  ORF g.422583 m.422583 type:complete len:451 (-) comp21329_c1_seq7:860-2212(-)